jgi:molybdate transport system substrate-binding protein
LPPGFRDKTLYVRAQRGSRRDAMKAIRLVVALAFLVVPVDIASAGEIRVLSLPGMRTVMEKVAPQFEDATGHRLSMQFALASQSRDTLESGAFDLVVLGSTSLDDLVKQNRVVPATRTEIGRIGIGVAIRAGDPKPDISTVEAFKRTLLNAKSISYTKGSGTGIYLAKLMERLGIAEEMKPKTRLMGGGGQNPRDVAAGDVELGISLVSDILSVPGVDILGLLPPEIQQYTIVTVGVGTTARDADAARKLIQFLISPATTLILKANRIEPALR